VVGLFEFAHQLLCHREAVQREDVVRINF